jgi:dehydrogenase/reductase SDR family member 7
LLQIDILVNNAGRSQRAWIADTELAVDREMIDLNVVGVVSLTKCVLPHMLERQSGHLVVTSSLASKMG